MHQLNQRSELAAATAAVVVGGPGDREMVVAVQCTTEWMIIWQIGKLKRGQPPVLKSAAIESNRSITWGKQRENCVSTSSSIWNNCKEAAAEAEIACGQKMNEVGLRLKRLRSRFAEHHESSNVSDLNAILVCVPNGITLAQWCSLGKSNSPLFLFTIPLAVHSLRRLFN